MAATFFFRPPPEAILQRLPSPLLPALPAGGKQAATSRTAGAALGMTARRYEKAKQSKAKQAEQAAEAQAAEAS